MRLKLVIFNAFIVLSLLSCNNKKPIYEMQISELETLEVFDTSLVPDNFKESDLLSGYKSIQEFSVVIQDPNTEELYAAVYSNPDKVKELGKNWYYYNIRVQANEETYNKFKAKEKLSKSDINELLQLPSQGAVYNSFFDEKGDYINIEFENNHQSKTYNPIFDEIKNRKINTDMILAYQYGMFENGMVNLENNLEVKKSYEKFKAFITKYDDYAERMKVGVDMEHLFFGYAGFSY